MSGMDMALALAREAAEHGEVPVGAVIIRNSDGMVVGKGRNRREENRDPLAHAEIEAISEAARTLGGWRLSGCTMYVTLEPCAMCAGAAVNARLDRIVYGAPDTSGGGYICPSEGVMCEECSQLIKTFFGRRRKMGSVRTVEAKTDDQLRRIAAIADEIWHEYFPPVIGMGQTDYMVEKFCSYEAMKENIRSEGYIYYFVKAEGKDAGYTAVKPDGDRLFLSKIYIYKEHRGKGYARAVIASHTALARSLGLRSIWLTVNKHNDTAIAAYEAMGFVRSGEVVADIGGGYVMDDYYYELTL